ncbi:DUF6773 family protein [Halalkalibacter okhensis]|uniref:Uncharacterized protein n=1 Tax=Halalkalibacter okhensis TaxID=333138 RepID=A0A0B0ICV9_9BACI|nr:DUF6773 family protein [Halalkalibacter okhensis]KHF38732.1 hypothetical protein LQ50_19430 [Halalkalibacter okhensis]
MGLFKKTKVLDERVEALRNKIYKEIYMLVTVICLLSVVIKSSIYGMDYDLFLIELLILLVGGFYYSIRAARLGIYAADVEISERSSKYSLSTKTLIGGLLFGLAISLFFGIRNSFLYGDETNRLWFFLLIFFVSFIIYVPALTIISLLGHEFMKKLNKNKTIDEE